MLYPSLNPALMADNRSRVAKLTAQVGPLEGCVLCATVYCR